MNIDKPITLDLLDTPGAPALSSSSDMPVVETKPDATNQGAPPAVPPAAEEAEGEAKQLEESATSTTENDDQTGQPASDKPRGVGKKIAELVKRSEDAELRAQAEREEKLRILALLEETRGKKADSEEQQPTDPEPVRPAKADFPDADAWEQALVDYADKKAAWTARREIQAAQAEEQRKAAMSEQERALEEAVERARADERDKFKASRLHDRVLAKAARLLNDPSDAVRLLDTSGIDVDSADADAEIDGRLNALLDAKPYLAVAEKATPSGSGDATSRPNTAGYQPSVGALLKAARGR